ncbi:pH regulation protein F [Halarchaeum sp. CBA1220]|uniref:Na(+)/H(+) antiporter subunit F n=1 Tax=Halarchaeum grantii TaxID=1193105 RepID=A0A830F9Q6_9EURY|nr:MULTISPECIES: monovalent cation/H+ antiporter complex subunit F [Halarchaeum]QLC33718.1 pH regulation protein F [Halarchaeum sp. CBA1220]GGL32823.1 Na(+)/H(+) antiporter subunit F [Halarchaeum grantii]
MSSVETVYYAVLTFGTVVAALATLACAVRVVVGPTVPDRTVALDAIGTCVVAIVVLHAIEVEQSFFVLVGVMLAIVGFVTTVVAAKYLTEGDIIE